MSSREETAETIRVEQLGRIAVVHLQKPPANAIDTRFAAAIADTMSALVSDDTTRAAVLTAQGRFFSAGLDLKVVPHYSVAEQRELMDAFSRMVEMLYGFPKPLVAAVNGHAVAGGMLLMLTTDHRVAAAGDLRFGLTGASAGIAYPISALSVIESELPPGPARNMVLRGKTFGTERALEWGIIDEVAAADGVLERCLQAADELSHLPGETYAAIKRGFRSAALERIVDGRNRDRTTPLVTDAAASAAQSLLGRTTGRRGL